MRGEKIFDMSWISTFDDDLERMNAGKRGRPYRYTHKMMAYLGGLASAYGMQFRALEGFLKTVMVTVGIDVPDFSTIWRRCISVNTAHPDGRDIVAAIDSTGIRVGVRGEWMREKWKVHKGWIKLHALTDVRTNRILSYAVTDELSADSEHLSGLVSEAVARGHRITKVLADGAYDTRDNWNFLRDLNIDFVPNIRKNASERFRGSCVRGLAVAERNGIGDKQWKERHGYGMRWKVESAFSDYKRMFGDHVRSRRTERMHLEMDMKIAMFNLLKGA
jgi:transposase